MKKRSHLLEVTINSGNAIDVVTELHSPKKKHLFTFGSGHGVKPGLHFVVKEPRKLIPFEDLTGVDMADFNDLGVVLSHITYLCLGEIEGGGMHYGNAILVANLRSRDALICKAVNSRIRALYNRLLG